MAIGAIGALIKTVSDRTKGTPLNSAVIFDEHIPFDADPGIGEAVQDNYLKYLNMAYILIGDYPDCEMIKISANVTRNDYNWAEDFYVAEGKLYYNYYKNGEALGKPGIDVSEFQKDIDWDRVKATGMQFAMIRVGYRGYGTGEIHSDKNYETNIDKATWRKSGSSCIF